MQGITYRLLGVCICACCIMDSCKREPKADVGAASLANGEQLATKCLLFARLHKDHNLPQHFAWLFYDPQMRGEGVRLNLYSTSTSGVPRFNTDWTPDRNWSEITTEVDRCSDYTYLGAGLRQPQDGDTKAKDVVIFYSKSPVPGNGLIVGQLDGKARFIVINELSDVLQTSDKLRENYAVRSAESNP